MTKHNTYFNWSSGKDSALALYKLQQDNRFLVNKLVTTTNAHFNRVTMHGLRIELLHQQFESIGLPFNCIELPEMPDMDTYNSIMAESTNNLKAKGFTHSAFGDIFLEDLKQYRETQLAKVGLTAIFPIWKQDTKTLLNQFLDLGFKTIVVCAQAKYFDEHFVGTIIDEYFINNLPEDVDPCGENGEFHTFCYDGPIFKHSIEFTIGRKTYREYDAPKTDNNHNSKDNYGVWYCDLLPK